MSALACFVLIAATKVALPKIDIVYPPWGTIFDRTCSGFVKDEDMKPAWIDETAKLRPALQTEWDREGPSYLRVVRDEVGLPFPYAEMQTVLTVCSVSTMSTPMMVNVRSFLPSSTRHPPSGDFTEKVFHELMHHYVAPVHATSALRRKYAAEPAQVTSHLHVMALEKLVLLRLGKTAELTYLANLYQTDPPPHHYRRAWEIVNAEGYEPFIAELKAAASR